MYRIRQNTMDPSKLELLRNAMQAYSWRAQALSSNIANLDTPGYRRLSVSFEDQLQELRRSVPGLRDLEDAEPRMQIEQGPPILEDELMELADTQMRNQLTSRALREHFDLVQMGITGRTG